MICGRYMNLHYMSASGTAYLFRHAGYMVGAPVDIHLPSTIKGNLHLSYR